MKPNSTNLSLLLILSALMAVTSLSVDIYLPALPAMTQALGGSAELTVTGFLVGFAIAQLIWGPISDRIGRKLPLFIGMLLFIVGSIGCALSNSMKGVIVWRVFQAFGACVAPMLSRAMIRDMYESTESAKLLSTLIVVMAIAPIAGPLIGGMLIKVSSWHAIFWLLAVIGAMLFVAVFRLPESLPKAKRATGSIRQSFANYPILLKNRVFMTYTLCVTFFYVAAYAFITGSPDVYIRYFHVPPQYYGLLFGLNIVGLMICSLVNRKLVQHYSLKSILRACTAIAGLGAIVLMVAAIYHIGGIYGVIVPMFVMFSMNGIIAATTNAAALGSVDSQMAGSAAALMGSLQYGSGIISSLLLAAFSDGTPMTMVIIILVFVLLSAGILTPKSLTEEEQAVSY